MQVFEILTTIVGTGALASVFTGLSKKLTPLSNMGPRRRGIVRTIAVTASVVGGVVLAATDGSVAPQSLQQGVLDIMGAVSIWISSEITYRAVRSE